MRNFLTIWRKELAACFFSPVAYIVLLVFLLISNSLFWYTVLGNEGSDESLATLLVVPIMLLMTVLITVVTMRLFAEEKRSGTIETLMTAPVTEVELVLGKYFGAISFLTIVIVPAMASVFILWFMSPGIEFLDYGQLAGGAIILLLFTSYGTSVGLLASLSTRNQVVAAICCFCGSLVPIILPMSLRFIPFCPDRLVQFFSVEDQIIDFTHGSIDILPIVLYVSLTVFFLFTAVQILTWKRLK